MIRDSAVENLHAIWEYEACIVPRWCGHYRACFLEQDRLKKGEELGYVNPPPCFISLWRSVAEAREVDAFRSQRRPPWREP